MLITTNSIITKLINTVSSALVLLIIEVIIYFIFRRKMETKKQRVKFKYRLTYVAVIVFLLVLTRIWIEGFTHIFTMLGLVATGFVVINKESIMNLIGWLIINWRGSFTKGDFIYIDSYSGYVDKIGPLYFKIYETQDTDFERATGKTIKLPNSLVITKPIMVLSSDTNLCLFTLQFSIRFDNNLGVVLEKLKTVMDHILYNKYGSKLTEIKAHLASRKIGLSRLLELTTNIVISPITSKNNIKLTIYFYCFPRDRQVIEQQFWRQILEESIIGNINLPE